MSREMGGKKWGWASSAEDALVLGVWGAARITGTIFQMSSRCSCSGNPSIKLISFSKQAVETLMITEVGVQEEDSDVDSSSDNSKSSSSGEPVLKKHKLVSSLISPENDETSGTPRSQAEGKSDRSSGDHFKIGKANKMQIGSSKRNNLDSKETKRDSFKKVNKKKKMHKLMPDGTNSRSSRRGGDCRQENVQVQHQNNFVLGLEAQNCKGGSLDRCVKRTANSTARSAKRKSSNGQENILAQHHAIFESGMKAQNWNSQVQHQDNFETGLEAQNCNDRSLEMSIKSHRTAGSSIPCEVPKDQVDQGQAIGPLTSTERNKGEMLDLSATRPNFLSNPSDQVASSMYLTLPTVLPEPCYENYRLDSSFCDYIQPGIAGNKMAMTSERSNLVPSASFHRGNFLGIQQEEKIGSFSQMGSRNVSGIDQNSIPTSSFSAGFPIPLHQGLNGYFNIPNQVGLENLPRENNILGLRMNGGAIRFSAGSNAFPEHFVANNLRSHLNYKADGGLMAFQTPDIKTVIYSKTSVMGMNKR
ncbi:hypothetical protein CK203_067701 [Vitis vinifera]|uniref:Uncharacterized protein n=1 Tax=Vitis vinifera TaxID=29760 RepID=A0A438BZG1_VITVI|nr:hypothetical protein CK203_067701 [Vitis vinifera]